MKSLHLIAIMVLLVGETFAQTNQNIRADLPAEGSEDLLLHSIIVRLQLSREVAWTKFCTHARVSDPAREAKVLADLKGEGRKIGISPEEVSFFFKPQIVASCRLQEELIAGWRSGFPHPSTQPMDLQRDIRPLIDKVSHDLLLEWKANSFRSFDRSYFYSAEEMIEKHGFSSDVARIAARPLGPRWLNGIFSIF